MQGWPGGCQGHEADLALSGGLLPISALHAGDQGTRDTQ